MLAFDVNIHAHIGLWRQHAEIIDTLSNSFHLFHTPELQDNYVQTLFKYLQSGNNHLRQKVCKAIATIVSL